MARFFFSSALSSSIFIVVSYVSFAYSHTRLTHGGGGGGGVLRNRELVTTTDAGRGVSIPTTFYPPTRERKQEGRDKTGTHAYSHTIRFGSESARARVIHRTRTKRASEMNCGLWIERDIKRRYRVLRCVTYDILYVL